MSLSDQTVLNETRRQFFARGARGIGSIALGSLIAESLGARTPVAVVGGVPGLPHFPAKAKRAIYLHMLGAPPQMETFDYKPAMKDWFDKDLPESIRQGQRLTTMTSGQTRFPIAPSAFKFAQYGNSGTWVSELLPYTAKMVDDMVVLRHRAGTLVVSVDASLVPAGVVQVAAFRTGNHPVRGAMVPPILALVPGRRRTSCRAWFRSGAYHGLAMDPTLCARVKSKTPLAFETNQPFLESGRNLCPRERTMGVPLSSDRFDRCDHRLRPLDLPYGGCRKTVVFTRSRGCEPSAAAGDQHR